MANETQKVYGSQVTLESSGGTVTNNGISAAATTAFNLTDDSPANYPDAEFVLTCSFSATPTASTAILLVVRPLNIDGTTDAPAPSGSYLHEVFSAFYHNGGSSSQTLRAYAENLPREGEVYLYNQATGVSISSGWTLKMTPVSRKPA